MTEVHRTHHSEVKKQQLRLTADTSELVRTLVAFTKPQYRDQLPNSLFMYSQGHYDLPANPADRKPEDVRAWNDYVKRVAEIEPYRQFNLKRPSSDSERLIGVFYDEQADLLRLSLPVMMGAEVLRRVVAPPMEFRRPSGVVDINERNVLRMVYTAPRPITGPTLLNGYIKELRNTMSSNAGAMVNELTIVGPETYDTPILFRPDRVRYNEPRPSAMTESPEPDNDAA